jgi:hypothetical protein
MVIIILESLCVLCIIIYVMIDGYHEFLESLYVLCGGLCIMIDDKHN